MAFFYKKSNNFFKNSIKKLKKVLLVTKCNKNFKKV